LFSYDKKLVLTLENEIVLFQTKM